MINLYTYSLGTIFLVGLAIIFAASEIGWQLGARRGGRAGGNVSTLESAMLGPLAHRLPVYIMEFLVSAVILLIFDLDQPSSGFIRNDQQSMIDVAASISAFSD
jgi:hypothetical protein